MFAKVGRLDAGVAAYLGGCAFGQFLPLVHHHDVVRQVHHQFHVVLDQQDAHLLLLVDAPQDAEAPHEPVHVVAGVRHRLGQLGHLQLDAGPAGGQHERDHRAGEVFAERVGLHQPL